jgi:hypothetical protein
MPGWAFGPRRGEQPLLLQSAKAFSAGAEFFRGRGQFQKARQPRNFRPSRDLGRHKKSPKQAKKLPHPAPASDRTPGLSGAPFRHARLGRKTGIVER